MKNIEVDVDVEMKSIQLQEPSADVPSPTGDVTPAGQKGKENGQRRRAHIQFATLCWSLYLAGWNDGTTGPLLPRIQRVYSVNFAVVSLLFVFACIGFMTGALSNLVLDGRYGFGKVIVLGSLFQVVAYCFESATPPFPLFVLWYAINGVGMALQNAQANGFVASLRDNPEMKMGILHAVRFQYISSPNRRVGAGAFSSPLVATQFAQQPHWSLHYLCSFGMALLNSILLIAVLPTEKSGCERSQFRQVFALRAVHLLAFFILVYVGVEVTVGGWIVTYIIDVRGGGPSSGYISSGFFGGLTAGRVSLLWVNRKVGERRALFVYAFLAIGLELIVWLVPSLVGGAVTVSVVGFFLGSMYPIAMNHAGRVLPRWLLTGSIGWIAGSGQAGSALLSFVTLLEPLPLNPG
ncbi:MFS general substrate transporter [Pisolithus orientalis]|uniref:MFS general substrate transporter n=1 Tax=Pisolithus orientalis TaxID=936130 RepID=UPI00222483F0|nr:MFS general substrate transporter [Pisolithus orientalis]KAI6019796.1 MFS general substrate transporter [Pisolithus orientalis]